MPSGRQRSLLALLLLAGGVPLSRDRLIDELWGERPPSSAVSALHVHLSKLRALLGGLLVLDTAGYALARTEFELDVWRFDELVEQARAEPARASVLLRDALALFRGEPLSDVAAERSIAGWRRALEDKRLQAIMLRIGAGPRRRRRGGVGAGARADRCRASVRGAGLGSADGRAISRGPSGGRARRLPACASWARRGARPRAGRAARAASAADPRARSGAADPAPGGTVACAGRGALRHRICRDR